MKIQRINVLTDLVIYDKISPVIYKRGTHK